MKNVISYRRKDKNDDTILQVHVQHALYEDVYQYRYIQPSTDSKGNINYAKVIAVSLGLETSTKWQHIDKKELETQLKQYGWTKIRSKSSK